MPVASTKKSPDWGAILGILVASIFFVLFWNTIWLYPIRLLVTLFHELSHGLAALFTGGRIVRIEIHPNGSGACVTSGGHLFTILNAGYLGSLAWGILFLHAASSPRYARLFLGSTGILLLSITVAFIRPIFGFGMVSGLLSGLGLLACSTQLSARINGLALRLIGMISCLYALLDIRADILDNQGLPSDATALGALTGISPIFWGILWSAIAVPAAVWTLIMTCRRPV